MTGTHRMLSYRSQWARPPNFVKQARPFIWLQYIPKELNQRKNGFTIFSGP